MSDSTKRFREIKVSRVGPWRSLEKSEIVRLICSNDILKILSCRGLQKSENTRLIFSPTFERTLE